MLQQRTVFSVFFCQPIIHSFQYRKLSRSFFWLCLSILRSFIRSWNCQRNPFVGADCLYVAGECFITLHIVSLLLVVWSAFCYQCNTKPMCSVFSVGATSLHSGVHSLRFSACRDVEQALMCFLNIKACIHFLSDTKKKSRNLKMIRTW